jgi:DNA-binding GntR family transcriptional regulator
MSGALAPGERLRIEALAAALGMSHLPIREAIRRLESVGLAEHIPHRGGRVTELSLSDLGSLYEARLLLEPELVARAAERFGAPDAELARACLDRQAAAEGRGEIRDVWNAHTGFHFSLYRPSGSSWLLRLVAPLWESSQRYRLTMPPLNSERRRAEAQSEHEQILAACSEHDGERARLLLHDHLAKTANLIVQEMGGDSVFALRQ